MSLLPQSAGYATIVVGGVFFGVLINILTFIQRRYTKFSPDKVEEFSSASRSVKTGLLTVGITSAWVWAAVFLQTGTLCYLYGVSTAWWFGCGGFIEIAAFAFLSSKIKENCGGSATFLQVAKVRYGTFGHLVFATAALIANFVVSAEILVGGTGVIVGMTGINGYAAIWLLPAVIVVYVLTGGLRATFVADYLHCCILFSCLTALVLSAYTRGGLSPGKIYDLLQEAAVRAPASGNAHGSYTTFRSEGSMYYAVIASTSFFGLSYLDQSYTQRAIAAKPKGTSKAFLLAGLFFFSIAFAVGSSMGLAARALEASPAWPIYPKSMTLAEIGAGLAGPYASVAILGHAGAAMYLIIAFMATTSAFSAQLVAVSSLVTYDIFRPYFRPAATNNEMLNVSHGVVVAWAIFMAGISSVFYHIGLDLNFLFYMMGVATSPAVFPVGLMMSWSKLSKIGATGGVIGGIVMGLVGWFVTAIKTQGAINVTTLTANPVILAGSLSGLGTGAIISIVLSLVAPDNFDFAISRAIGSRRGPTNTGSSSSEVEKSPSTPAKTEEFHGDELSEEYLAGLQDLNASQWKFRAITIAIIVVIFVLIPAPLGGTAVVYTKSLFTLQCVAAATFLLASVVTVISWPILESISDIREIWGRIRRNERLDATPFPRD
ncbi:SSS family solute:Na+ symporter [Meredithblackwellia eburnea MCA 4105]